MANELQIKRGQSANLPAVTLLAGEPAITLDTKKLYFGDGAGDKFCINPDILVSGGTFTKVTVDKMGRVTAGSAITANDIPSIPSTKVTGLGTAALANTGTAAGNVPILGAGGLLPPSVIPETTVDAGSISGVISLDNLPKGALERCVVVANDAARFALTAADVQMGDTVKVTGTGLMYFVVDETKLSTEAGYEPYTASAATSVPWSGITGKPTTLAGYGITDAEPKITTKNTAFNRNFGTSASALKMNGAAAVGTSNDVARIDHVHPVDTTRAAAVHTHAQDDVTGLVTTLAAKAPLASPTFTGTPKSTTPAGTDNSTRIATTAYVKAQGYMDSSSLIDCGTF